MSAVQLAELAQLDVSSWTLGKCADYVGGLSKPSKMPGYSYGLPAAECITGTKLRAVKGSTCSECYAYERGMYRFPGTKRAQYRRLASIGEPLWVQCMAELIGRRAAAHPHFRWHDSGDIQSVEHLHRIFDVCELTPTVSHWIPTREYRLVREALAERQCPPNLCIRMSAHMIGGAVPRFPKLAVTVSTVSPHDAAPADAHDCPARTQDNECGSCRACWNPLVPLVNYALH